MSKHIHFVGIGGAGLSALARVMLARGWRVSGSDRERSPRTALLEREGATLFLGHSAEWVQGADVVVVSSAVPADNPEWVAALAAGIPVYKRDRFLPTITQDSDLIAIAGTHGKTTTSAMIAMMLTQAGLDPTAVIGGEIPALGGNARVGASRLFILEADEYDRAFLGLSPTIAVVLNVEHDHPDIYPDEQAVQEVFQQFVAQVRPGGTIVACTDDSGVREVLRNLTRPTRVISYALEAAAEWQAGALRANQEGGTDFVAIHNHQPFGAFRLRVPGQHNVLNALAAIAVGFQMEVDAATMQATFAHFTGAERRFQPVGTVGRRQIFDDYAHHPTEIRATLAAARQQFGERPLWVVFQPHTFSRLAALRAAFVEAFDEADQVIVSDVYAAREQGDAAGQGSALAALIERRGASRAAYEATQEEILHRLLTTLPEDVILLTLGAGDITSLGPRLRRALEEAPLTEG